MKESALLERYALALDLVPDLDLAGDLFMTSPDAATLLRRANRWRERNGLPPVVRPSTVRALSAAEQEHALHLIRRGRRRRMLQRVGGALVIMILCVAGFRLLPEASVTGLAADPIFSGTPLERATHPDGFRIAVYNVEADPGSVTVWWSATGLGTERAAAQVKPRLMLDAPTGEWLLPAEQETGDLQGRLVARTRFTTFVTTERTALFAFTEQPATEPTWLLRLPLAWGEDESAQVVPLDQSITRGPVTVRLLSLTRGGSYTQLRYTVDAPSGERPPNLYGLRASNLTLERKRPVTEEAGVLVATFEPLPAGTTQVRLLFTPVMITLPPRTYAIPGDPAIELYTRTEDLATLVAVVELDTWGAAASATLVGENGVRYPADLSFQIEGTPAKNRILVRAGGLPPGVAMRSLTLEFLRRSLDFRPSVELPPDKATGPGD